MQTDGRVLMIACAFPPTGGSGVQRSTKFAKYLPSFGWHPIVWTAGALEKMPRDDTLAADLPEEVVVHAHPWSRSLSGARLAAERLAEMNGLLSTLGRAARWRIDARVASAERRMNPDHYISWAENSVQPLCRLVDKVGIRVIYSTFSPGSNHWLGLKLKRATGLPWVADFRDLWTDDYRYAEKSSELCQSHRLLEQEILHYADVVIGVTKSQTQILANHVPNQDEKFITIANGFDPDDFAVSSAKARNADADAFRIAHVGRFDHWRARDAWFAGLKQFVAFLAAHGDRFELRIVGHADPHTRAKIVDTGVRCSFSGFVSHDRAIAEMRSADALLLCVPEGRNATSVIPAKLFEYLASRRPVLAVGPSGGEAERIVQSCHAGLTVGFDRHAITGALCELYDAWHAERPLNGCATEALGPFSRVSQTRHLAWVFDDLTNRHRAAPPVARTEAVALADSIA